MKLIATVASWGLLTLALGGLYIQHRRISQLETSVFSLRTYSPNEAAHGTAGLALRVARLERDAAWRAAAPTPPGPPAAPAAPAAPASAGAEVQQLREDVDALLTGEATATEQGKARLRALITETQQQQGNERQTRRDERLLQQLTEVAHLNTRQRDDLSQALAAERTQRQELMAKARAEFGNFESVRPALQALRAKTDEKARAILDAEQYNQYTASRSFGRGSRQPGGNAEARPTP